MAQAEKIKVIDKSGSDENVCSVSNLADDITGELEVFSKAASVYFEEYQTLHRDSERKRPRSSLADFFKNTRRAHKAAWKYVIEHSDVHKRNERRLRGIVPDSAIENLHEWLDSDD